jgi:lantibiotic modifying enzyme
MKSFRNIENKIEGEMNIASDLEQKILYHLMLKSMFIRDCGLLHGKIGIALFFYSFSKRANNEVFSDFADDLLDSIWETTYNNSPVSFASGLTGIAWGIEYLLQNNFVSGIGNNICEEIDKKIMSLDVRRLNSEFIENELNGLLYYILIRIKGSILQQTEIPFDETYQLDLIKVLHSLKKSKNKDCVFHHLSNSLFDYLCNKKPLSYIPNLLYFIDREYTLKKEEDILHSSFGLKNGMAGYLYKRLIIQLG